MGQTLTHGIYLPDEGERNCYNGLAANWSILDGAVGTIAEHTSALSGKAPLVHTHGKADITDLFNSANTWSASQTFTENSTFSNYITSKESAAISAGSYGKGIAFRDYQNNRLGYIQPHLTSDNEKRLVIGADSGKVALNSNTIPNANNSYDLGSSSYQWNNLYAKNYYYNGTAWGLDKLNTWSAVNQYSREIQLAGDRNSFIAPMWEGAGSGMAFLVSDASKAICFGIYTDDANNNNRKIVDSTKGRMIIRVGEKNSETYLEVEPRSSNAALGNSSNKWKTLNGINPGALGIPSGVKQSISEYITDVNLGWNNQITAVRDGYIIVTINDAAGNSIFIFNNTKQYSNSCYGNGSQGTGRLSCILPVNEGDLIYIFIKAAALSDVFSADLYVMNGNVNALPSS